MHVTIVTFKPGAVIPFLETHVMEHGLYVLEGKARLSPQQRIGSRSKPATTCGCAPFARKLAYAGGPGDFRYLLYKDVNRHMPLRPLSGA